MTQTTALSTVANPVPSSLFVGLDVGDRNIHMCVLDDLRNIVERGVFPTTREDVRSTFAGRAPSRIVIEVGSQSPWLWTELRDLGHDVVVADARRVAAFTRSGRKTDRKDAEMLARLLQGMPELLGSVHHRGEQAQADLAVIRARDLAVRTRTSFVQHVRGTLKALGLRAPACSARGFHRRVLETIPESHGPALGPVLTLLGDLERTIRGYEKEIVAIAAARYPEVTRLLQVNGVGPITSLAFVLTLDDASRFEKSRTVGSYLGLCPRVLASGDHDPQLSISKTGDSYLRRLLVQSAHYILGRFGKDSDLRRYGLRLVERGGKAAKSRAAVAVARKLAVLLHRLWMSGEDYEPLRNSESGGVAA